MEIGHEQPGIPTCFKRITLLVEDMWVWSKLSCLGPLGCQSGERFHSFSRQDPLQETEGGPSWLYWWGPRGKQRLLESSTELVGSERGQVESCGALWRVGVQGPLQCVPLSPAVSAWCQAAPWPTKDTRLCPKGVSPSWFNFFYNSCSSVISSILPISVWAEVD